MSMITRYIIFVVAIIIQSSGIALVVKSLLGTSPISSFPYVLSLATGNTLGMLTFIVNMVMLLGQIALLRRDFDKIQLLQVPMTMIFAYFIDVFMNLYAWVKPESYIFMLIPLLLGTAGVSLGVALQGIANVLMLPGEGLVYAVSRRFNIDFAKVKTSNDVFLVTLAAICSFVSMGSIEGIREGTLISALLTGVIAKFFLRHLSTVDERGHLRFHPHL